MATDDILDDKDAPAGEKPAGAPSFSKTDISDAVKEGLSGLKGELGQFAKDVGAHVQNAIAQTQQKVDKGTASKGEIDLTQRLLTEPENVIRELMQEWATTNLGPYFQTQVNDTYDSLVEKHRKDVDARWGEGAFDEFIRPDFEATIKATNSPVAKASKEYITAVVRGIVGHEDVIPKLIDKKAKVAEKRAEDEKNDAPVGILDGGRRKPGKLTLSDSDRQYLVALEDRTGEKADPKLLENAITVRARDGVWNIDNFPGLKQQ